MNEEDNNNVVMLNGILLYLKIGAYPSCHQRGFLQQLMEDDTDLQSNIRWRTENPVEKIAIVRGV